ncbi:MAG: phosphatidate cytidylyltransferase [Clostridiales bacterium]|nr:phosphatidate cytidylyltransferase [Clostridiales bacterium]
MKTRVITGLVAGGLFIAMFFLLYTWVYPVMLAIFAAIGVWEIEKAVGLKNKLITVLSLAVSAAIPFVVHFHLELPLIAIISLYCIAVLILMLIQFEKTRFEHAAIAIFASLAVPYALSCMLALRDMYLRYPDTYTKSDGIFFILFGLFCAWMTDTFAFFVGSKFGKHKMCPKISPKKSIEGAIGGVIGAAVLNLILLAVFKKFFSGAETNLSYIGVALVSVLLSVISMLGDLAASTIKRNYGVKDFGKLFPGHGGVMDRADSVSFVLPTLCAVITLINA